MPRHNTPSGYLKPDPALAANLAGQFGAGVGNAEELIEANALRFTEDLRAAQLLPTNEDATGEFTVEEVAEAVGAPVKAVKSYAAHGDPAEYVVVVVEAADGRWGKEVARVEEDGSLTPTEPEDSPRRAALQASLEANQVIADAKAKAAEIIADAEASAAKARKAATAAEAGDDLSALSVKALRELADERGVEVKGAAGKKPTKADYLKALEG